MGGASKLPYKVALLANEICSVHVFVDGDSEGIGARDKAIDQGAIKILQTNVVNCKGMKESEFEDVLDLNSYKEEVLGEYGVDLGRPEFKAADKKWSDRVARCFVASSKPWGEKIEAKVKLFVAELIAQKITEDVDVLHAHRGQPLLELVAALEQRLSKSV